MDKQNTAVYVNKYLLEGLGGVKDIKIYGREKYLISDLIRESYSENT